MSTINTNTPNVTDILAYAVSKEIDLAQKMLKVGTELKLKDQDQAVKAGAIDLVV